MTNPVIKIQRITFDKTDDGIDKGLVEYTILGGTHYFVALYHRTARTLLRGWKQALYQLVHRHGRWITYEKGSLYRYIYPIKLLEFCWAMAELRELRGGTLD